MPRFGALAVAAGLLAATEADAGLLVNHAGIFWTAPEPSRAMFGTVDGQPRAAGPASGFRRFGREGYFLLPRDPGQPFHGRAAYGAAGRIGEPADDDAPAR